MWFNRKAIEITDTTVSPEPDFEKAVADEIKKREDLAERKLVAKTQAIKNLTSAKKQNTKLLADAKKKLCPYIGGQKLCAADGCHAWAGGNDTVDGDLSFVWRMYLPSEWQEKRIKVDMGGHCNFKGVIKCNRLDQ